MQTFFLKWAGLIFVINAQSANEAKGIAYEDMRAKGVKFDNDKEPIYLGFGNTDPPMILPIDFSHQGILAAVGDKMNLLEIKYEKPQTRPTENGQENKVFIVRFTSFRYKVIGYLILLAADENEADEAAFRALKHIELSRLDLLSSNIKVKKVFEQPADRKKSGLIGCWQTRANYTNMFLGQ